MKNEDIYNIATAFRSAILEAKYNREFKRSDRMSNFPVDCCDDSCDLLGYYLYNGYNIHTKQRCGKNVDEDKYHALLILDDDTIIDITGDQFRYCSKDVKEVHVGKETSFYKRLKDKRTYENYDITQCDRLWNDYKIIMRYIESTGDGSYWGNKYFNP